MIYQVKEVRYNSDSIHVEEFLNTIEYDDLLEAYKEFQRLKNAILVECNQDREILLAKKSKGFSVSQIKQYYLDEACDILGFAHLIYSQLSIDEIADTQITKLIESILMEELSIRAGSVRGPILNELLNILTERR